MSVSQTTAAIAVSLPDGSVRRYDNPVTVAEIARDIGPGLAKAALAAKVDGKERDLSYLIDRDATLEIITNKSTEALELLRHDAAHVMAEAVKELYPETQVTIGPAIEDGFYYDFARDRAVHPRGSGKDRGSGCARSSTATRRSPARNGTATRRSAISTRSARSTRPRSSATCPSAKSSRSINRATSSISASARICPRPQSSARRSS